MNIFQNGGAQSLGQGADALGSSLIGPEQERYNQEFLSRNESLASKLENREMGDNVQSQVENGLMSLGPKGAVVGGLLKGGRLLNDYMDKDLRDQYGVYKGNESKHAFADALSDNLDVGGQIRHAFDFKGESFGESLLDVGRIIPGVGIATGYFSNKIKNKKATQERNTFLTKTSLEEGAARQKESAILKNSLDAQKTKGTLYGRAGLKVPKYQDGGKVLRNTKTMTFEEFVNYYDKDPEDKLYNIKGAYELYKKDPKNFDHPERGIAIKEKDGWHFSSVNPETGEFLKHKNHPTIHKELLWYESFHPDAIEFKKKNRIDVSGEYPRYVPRTKFSR